MFPHTEGELFWNAVLLFEPLSLHSILGHRSG